MYHPFQQLYFLSHANEDQANLGNVFLTQSSLLLNEKFKNDVNFEHMLK